MTQSLGRDCHCCHTVLSTTVDLDFLVSTTGQAGSHREGRNLGTCKSPVSLGRKHKTLSGPCIDRMGRKRCIGCGFYSHAHCAPRHHMHTVLSQKQPYVIRAFTDRIKVPSLYNSALNLRMLSSEWLLLQELGKTLKTLMATTESNVGTCILLEI